MNRPLTIIYKSDADYSTLPEIENQEEEKQSWPEQIQIWLWLILMALFALNALAALFLR